MANMNTPYGFRPIRHKSGAPYNGACNPYICIAETSTALYVGDIVLKLVAGSKATASIEDDFPGGTLQSITVSDGSDLPVGVIVGFGPNRDDLTKQYKPTLTERIVYVADDPDLIFVAQEDSDSDNIVFDDIGLNCDATAAGGSTVTGISGFTLDSNTANVTNTLQFHVHNLYDIGSNAGTASTGVPNYAQFEVSFNFHSLAHNTVGL